jgi:hypothetical protein
LGKKNAMTLRQQVSFSSRAAKILNEGSCLTESLPRKLTFKQDLIRGRGAAIHDWQYA